jgi:hypothetical protein
MMQDIKRCKTCQSPNVVEGEDYCPNCMPEQTTGSNKQLVTKQIRIPFYMWLLPSVILLPIAIIIVSLLGTSWISTVTALIAAVFAGIGFSQLFAGLIKWWIVFLIFIGDCIFIGFTRIDSVIFDFITFTILVCVIGIPIANSYRKEYCK